MSQSEKSHQNSTNTPRDAGSNVVPEATEVTQENTKYLLAEDNKVNVRLFGHLLNKLGLESTYQIAWNGQEAVDVYKAHPEQCKMIFMDISMPVMGGMQASLEIREYEKENNLQPTIIVGLVACSITLEGQRERLVNEYGMDTVLRKPFRLEELRQLLEERPV
jgi:CheY-like chemotaxis protein